MLLPFADEPDSCIDPAHSGSSDHVIELMNKLIISISGDTTTSSLSHEGTTKPTRVTGTSPINHYM